MATATKSSREVPKGPFATARNEFADTFLPLYEKGIEHLAEFQKNSLELAARQNTEWTGALKKAFHFQPETPAAFWIDAAGRTFEKYVDIQKEFLDHVVEQSHAMAKFNREYGELGAREA